MNIIEYAQNYGVHEFSENPFNEVDGLALSQLSYLKFDGIVPGPSDEGQGILLSSIMSNEKYEKLYADERYEPNNRKFFEALSASERFGKLYLGNFINVIDESVDVQFSAMTVTDGADFRAVVFRGTDDNMVGWKEDLNMTFKLPIPAQKYSVGYLERVASKWDGPFYVMGHSKGGNLSVYSAMNCAEEVRERIINIYSYDGPGFRTELLHDSYYDVIKNRIHKLVPKACVIGMFGNAEKVEVVDCIGVGGVIQHNPYNWLVDETSFIRTEHLGRSSELMAETVSMWTAEMTEEQWALLSDKLFGVIQDAGITNLNEFYDDFFGTMARMKASADKLDDDSKKKIQAMLSMYKDSATIVAKEGAKTGMHMAREEAKAGMLVAREEAKVGIHAAEQSLKIAKDAAMKAADEKISKAKQKAIDSKYTKLN